MSRKRPRLKAKYALVAFGVLSVAMFLFMLTLAYAMLALPNAMQSVMPTLTPTRNPALMLPTAPNQTASAGPPAPEQIIFTAEQPITGYSNCETYGFEGLVTGYGSQRDNVQVVVWDEQVGLLGLSALEPDGQYAIQLEDDVAQHRLWVQIYQNDLPVSQPVQVEPQIDCDVGYQVFQINWRTVN